MTAVSGTPPASWTTGCTAAHCPATAGHGAARPRPTAPPPCTNSPRTCPWRRSSCSPRSAEWSAGRARRTTPPPTPTSTALAAPAGPPACTATAVAWGAWAGGGMADAGRGAPAPDRDGLLPMDPGRAPAALAREIAAGDPAVVLADVDWARLRALPARRTAQPADLHRARGPSGRRARTRHGHRRDRPRPAPRGPARRGTRARPARSRPRRHRRRTRLRQPGRGRHHAGPGRPRLRLAHRRRARATGWPGPPASRCRSRWSSTTPTERRSLPTSPPPSRPPRTGPSTTDLDRFARLDPATADEPTRDRVAAELRRLLDGVDAGTGRARRCRRAPPHPSRTRAG